MSIEIDCANARAEARKLIDISEQCSSIKSTVLREKDLISEYMYGNTGSSIMEAMSVWSNGLGSIESDLVSLSNTITSIANDMEAAERRRAQEAKKKLEQSKATMNTVSHIVSPAKTNTSSPRTDGVQNSAINNKNTIEEMTNRFVSGLTSLGQSLVTGLMGRRK